MRQQHGGGVAVVHVPEAGKSDACAVCVKGPVLRISLISLNWMVTAIDVPTTKEHVVLPVEGDGAANLAVGKPISNRRQGLPVVASLIGRHAHARAPMASRGSVPVAVENSGGSGLWHGGDKSHLPPTV